MWIPSSIRFFLSRSPLLLCCTQWLYFPVALFQPYSSAGAAWPSLFQSLVTYDTPSFVSRRHCPQARPDGAGRIVSRDSRDQSLNRWPVEKRRGSSRREFFGDRPWSFATPSTSH